MRNLKLNLLIPILLLILIAPIVLGPSLRAQGISEKDQAELKKVVLTTESLTKLVNTLEALVKLLREDAELQVMFSESEDSDEEDQFSIDGMAAGFEKLPPHAKAALTSQGLSTRQYAVLTIAVLVNGIAYAGNRGSESTGPMPPGATKANIDFIQANAKSPIVQKWRSLIGEMESLEGDGEEEEAEAEDPQDN